MSSSTYPNSTGVRLTDVTVSGVNRPDSRQRVNTGIMRIVRTIKAFIDAASLPKEGSLDTPSPEEAGAQAARAAHRGRPLTRIGSLPPPTAAWDETSA